MIQEGIVAQPAAPGDWAKAQRNTPIHDGREIKHLHLSDSKIACNGVPILTYQPANSARDA